MLFIYFIEANSSSKDLQGRDPALTFVVDLRLIEG